MYVYIYIYTCIHKLRCNPSNTAYYTRRKFCSINRDVSVFNLLRGAVDKIWYIDIDASNRNGLYNQGNKKLGLQQQHVGEISMK